MAIAHLFSGVSNLTFATMPGSVCGSGQFDAFMPLVAIRTFYSIGSFFQFLFESRQQRV